MLNTGAEAIIRLNAEHPDWPIKLLANAAGVSDGYTSMVINKHGLKVPSWWEYQKSVPSDRVTIATRIKAYLVQHPLASSREIGKALGKPTRAINKAAQAAGIEIRRMSQAEKSAAHKEYHQNKLREEIKAAGEQKPADLDPVKPKAKVPRSNEQRYFLRDAEGRYIHQSLTVGDAGFLMTVLEPTYAWRPTRQQILNVAARFPEIAGMRMEEVGDD